MSERARHSGPGEGSGAPPPRPAYEKKISVEFTGVFDKNFAKLSPEIQRRARETIAAFLDSYLTRQFPKGLRVHKCGPFLSLSVSMNYRIFVLPVTGGVKFSFVGDHEDADRYLKRGL